MATWVKNFKTAATTIFGNFDPFRILARARVYNNEVIYIIYYMLYRKTYPI